MKNIKSFNEMRKSNIHTGIKLTPKQINYISYGIDKEYLEHFEILLDDGVFYVKINQELWEFDRIQDLRDLIHLRHYISKNKPDELIEIIKRNKNLDYSFQANWLIGWASVNGYAELVKLLLKDPKVDPSAWDNCSIRLSSENGHTEVVKLLLQDDRVDPSARDNYAIKWANAKRHTEVVKLLIQHPKVRATLTEKQIEKYEKS